MADITRMMEALRNADAAGDTAAATRLAAMVRDAQQGPEAPLPETAAQGPMSWRDVPRQALKNIPDSAGQFASSLVEPILHPINTAKAVYQAGSGALRKLAGAEPNEDTAVADAVGKFFSDRYGGMENFKKTIATDPVGFAADVSTVLTGGGALAAKVPGMIGQTGKAVSAVGRAIDPLAGAAKAVGAVGKRVVEPIVSSVIGNMTTNTGAESIRQAARAGYSGGWRGQTFLDNMRGNVSAEKLVDDAHAALETMRRERQAAYKSGAASFKADKTVLDFAPIEKAYENLRTSIVVQGEFPTKSTSTGAFQRPEHLSVGKQAANKLEEIRSILDEWGGDPSIHTVEGLDALKKRIDDLRPPATERGQADRIVTSMRNAVKNEIVKQAPEYAKVMKDYETASDALSQIERSLSLGQRATADTAIRKLQSVMRNNVSSNYGKRSELVNQLEGAGGVDILPAVSGQALSSLTPRGFAGQAAGTGVIGGGFFNPAIWASAPLMSPRVMGETAYYAGKGVRAANLAEALLGNAGITTRGIGVGVFQSGRIEDENKKRLATALRSGG